MRAIVLTASRPRWRTRLPLLLLALIVALGAGCGTKRDRLMLKQADQALDSGNPRAAANVVRQVLQNSPRNILAIRMLGKIKRALLKSARADVNQGKYKSAMENLQVLLELEPDHEEAKALRAEAEKGQHVEEARAELEKRHLGTALQKVQKALQLDPNFQPAVELREELLTERDVEIKRLLDRAPQLLADDKSPQVVTDMQEVLKLDPNRTEAQALLREAQVAKLAKEKRENLDQARKYLQEARYEAAIEAADRVLKADPTSFEAKSLKEKANALLNRPELLLTGVSVIRGLATAAVEVPELSERRIVKKGDEIGPYRVVQINPPDKTLTVEFIPTGQLLVYSTDRE